MNFKGSVLLILAVVTVSACATIPAGPSVMVLPGPGKPFEVFQSDDAVCRQWASSRLERSQAKAPTRPSPVEQW